MSRLPWQIGRSTRSEQRRSGLCPPSFPTRTVLAAAIIVFGLISTLFLIIDAATGGKPRLNNANQIKYGSWKYVLLRFPEILWGVDFYLTSPDALFPLYMISGISYGMVELIRRIIPRDIVGGDVQSVYKMYSQVHHI